MLPSTLLSLVTALFSLPPGFPCRCLCNGNTPSTKGLYSWWSNFCKSPHNQSRPTFSSYGHAPVLASLLHSVTSCNWGHGPDVCRQPHDAGGLQPLTSPPGHSSSRLSLPHVGFALPSCAIFFIWFPTRSLAVANLSGRVVWAAVTDRIGVKEITHPQNFPGAMYPSPRVAKHLPSSLLWLSPTVPVLATFDEHGSVRVQLISPC